MGQVQRLAQDLGADERTVRRAVEMGGVRAHRPSPRSLELGREEIEYLRGHWDQLAALRGAFRTEPSVRLAVLYGSVARGDDHDGSDLDLLVALEHAGPFTLGDLTRRLEARLGRRVDVAELSDIERRSPVLLLGALDEGRVVIDRHRQWPNLVRRRSEIEQRADANLSAQLDGAAATLSTLVTR